MHTVMMVGAGLVVLALFVVMASVLGKPAAAGARWFLPLWLVVSLVNLYIGTTHGYSVVGELPFLAVVFGVPALAAFAVTRWLRVTAAK